VNGGPPERHLGSGQEIKVGDFDMRCVLAKLATGLVSGALLGAGVSVPAAAGEMKPDEAKRFIAGKLFSYSCFDGTKGAGRIHADGSVVGTMQVNSGRMRFVALPAGTIKLGSDSICASLPRAIIQPCFNVVQTSPSSFRGSLKALSFAYCDFVRHNPRMNFARNEQASDPHTAAAPHTAPASHAAAPQAAESSAVALRPSRY
jgi:hypothetical protein